MRSVRQLSMRFTLIFLMAFCASGPALAQSRFDAAALRLALRGIEPPPATRQAEDGWRRVLGLAPGTRVSIRTDGGVRLSGGPSLKAEQSTYRTCWPIPNIPFSMLKDLGAFVLSLPCP